MTYTELFKDMISRFEVAAAVNGSAVWNAVGSKASATLLKEISARFDGHVAEQADNSARDELLAMAASFQISEEITVVHRGHDRWAISNRTSVYNTDGEWEYEPMPSSRDDEFFDRCRYSRDEAIKIAQSLK